eukprot:TRINITY_DN3189_c0_g1_i2.p1 TRINITY_DN3189_c0_g1~~TRINITY_DN3189_c0_g1_i2.p1  ORF type:complete len:294 (-),score=60.97 TRINITY_DN3189_c0_g1_i2:534-1415(-)
MEEKQTKHYYVVKCRSTDYLSYSIDEKVWCIPVRKIQGDHERQLFDILNEQFNNGDQVFFILSVSGTKKYQGVFTMVEAVKEKHIDFPEGVHINEIPLSQRLTDPFAVEWLLWYEHVSQGLEYSQTEYLETEDGVKVNVCRNLTEIPFSVGVELYDLIKEDIALEEEKKKQTTRYINAHKEATPFHEILQERTDSVHNQVNETEIRHYSEDLFQACQSSEPEEAKQLIIDLIQQEAFAEFIIAEPSLGIYIIAYLNSEVAEAIGSSTSVVFLSYALDVEKKKQTSRFVLCFVA